MINSRYINFKMQLQECLISLLSSLLFFPNFVLNLCFLWKAPIITQPLSIFLVIHLLIFSFFFSNCSSIWCNVFFFSFSLSVYLPPYLGFFMHSSYFFISCFLLFILFVDVFLSICSHNLSTLQGTNLNSHYR